MNKKQKTTLKKIFIMLYTALAFLSFGIISRIDFPKYHFIEISLDTIIPFAPSFVYFYFLLYPLIIFTIFKNFNSYEKFKKTCNSFSLLYLISGIIFIIYPTEIIRALIEQNKSFAHSLISHLYNFDPPRNLFPSLHVSQSLMIGSLLIRENKKYLILAPFLLLIIISIVFIKQHYILDILGGILVFIIVD